MHVEREDRQTVATVSQCVVASCLTHLCIFFETFWRSFYVYMIWYFFFASLRFPVLPRESQECKLQVSGRIRLKKWLKDSPQVGSWKRTKSTVKLWWGRLRLIWIFGLTFIILCQELVTLLPSDSFKTSTPVSLPTATSHLPLSTCPPHYSSHHYQQLLLSYLCLHIFYFLRQPRSKNKRNKKPGNNPKTSIYGALSWMTAGWRAAKRGDGEREITCVTSR